ncbi:amidohydrolase family protein, partial [Xanthovirga aplysinae]|uniref:amidohydrolase family protein n=1 Tax=Xanthovirga aplysinae TaxID=2529853 RepID=UPI0012BC7B21
AQDNFPKNGVQDKRPEVYAFTNATIQLDFQTSIEGGILLIEKGKVKAVGKNINIPTEAIIIDLGGKYIYPSFIDPYTNYGLPEVKKGKRSDRPQIESNEKGAYNWNEAIKSYYTAAEEFEVDPKLAKELRNLGFGAVASFRPDGIARGTSVLVNLGEKGEQEEILNEQAAAHFSFKKGSSRQTYPSSLMGSIALLRQTYLDANWYSEQKDASFHDLSLEGINKTKALPQIFEASDKLDVLRVDKIRKEFGIQYIIKGGGDEYQLINEIQATDAALIVPLNFPKALDVEDPFDALNASLKEMKHWELAPTNPSVLAAHNRNFAFTTDGLKEKKDFLKNLRKAVKAGLSEKDALKALTVNAAQMLRAQDLIGALKKGMIANFFISSDNIFKEESTIYENWVQGERFVLADLDQKDYSGNYKLHVAGKVYDLEISGKAMAPKFQIIENDTTKIKVSGKIDETLVNLSFSPDDKGEVRLSGWIKDQEFQGKGQLADGKWISWDAQYAAPLKKEEKEEKEDKEETPVELGKVTHPFVAYGDEQLPKSATYLIKNTTVWTNEEEGILENTDVLVKDGKIQQLGKGLSASGAIVIDGKGKHLTTGIIDEHSHIGISKGVNEGGQSVSAEVRIGDVINSEDVNIYRQLAGGVTSAQLLHGSANPVGGQSALVKLRWGKSPEEMKIKDADGYIKFALGENVKQSNWGDYNTIRFPQTRMGVEQVFFDAFTRAKAYEKEWNAYNSLSSRNKRKTVAPRKDLELETLVEILNAKRFITCHSYVQSEINMLMQVADSMGFKVNTFTHILEGYKVADKMHNHGVGASTFADWWAYKFEVREAIPYNATLMNGQGVVTAINSDDAEMGRRLNQEAAKSVKYGGMSEEEAWKMVTLNPAKLLHLDDRMGSVKAGKDADLVLWSDNPLSIYAKAEKTMIDGVIYFDLERDLAQREAINTERARLIKKMREAKANGEGTKKVVPEAKALWHCEDLTTFSYSW